MLRIADEFCEEILGSDPDLNVCVCSICSSVPEEPQTRIHIQVCVKSTIARIISSPSVTRTLAVQTAAIIYRRV